VYAPVTAEGLRVYRLNLAAAAREFGNSHILNGAQAEERRVVVEIIAERAGSPPSVSLQVSSGVAEVDRTALAMMRYAVRMAVVPNSMQASPFRLEVPVEFLPAK